MGASTAETRVEPVSGHGNPVEGKRVSVIGAARSGVAAAAMLHQRGARVFVSDHAPAETIANRTTELRALGIGYETDGHSPRVLDADLLVISPGVPSDLPVIREAVRRGIRVVSEMEAASWFCPAPIVGVTGTNGKTTTTTLIGRMLADARRRHVVGGNIGTAFSSLLGDVTPDSVAVLEVSSFQLDYVETFRPAVSVLLNITPDHLDRYDHDFAKYIAAKCRIFERQTPEDVLVYNADDPETKNQVDSFAAGRVGLLRFSMEPGPGDGAWVENGMLVTRIGGNRSEIVAVGEISIPGTHNLYNAMAATLAVMRLGVPVPSIRATLRNFKGVEHRLEFVRELNGVAFVNDSKATNVDSVWYALQSFTRPLVVLIGGRDKGNDYRRLVGPVREHVRGIVAIGESAGKVVSAFANVTRVVEAGSMADAIREARKMAQPGDTVLLSPACASFDWFENYEHRGRVFKELVRGLE